MPSFDQAVFDELYLVRDDAGELIKNAMVIHINGTWCAISMVALRASGPEEAVALAQRFAMTGHEKALELRAILNAEKDLRDVLSGAIARAATDSEPA